MTAPPYTVSDGTAPANLIYAEDLMQLIQGFTGQRDLGMLSLLKPLGTANSTGITTSLSSGSLSGTYKYAIYWVTGVLDGTATPHITGRTIPSSTTTVTPSSQRVQVNIGSVTVPTGAIGWGVARTHAGGSQLFLVPGSEQFPATTLGSFPTTYTDNTADASLVTNVQTTDTTGTSITGATTAYQKAMGWAGGVAANTNTQSLISNANSSGSTGFLIPANTLGANGAMRLRMSVQISTGTTNANGTLSVNFGGIAFIASTTSYQPGGTSFVSMILLDLMIVNMAATNRNTVSGTWLQRQGVNGTLSVGSGGTGNADIDTASGNFLVNGEDPQASNTVDTTLNQHLDVTWSTTNAGLLAWRQFATLELL